MINLTFEAKWEKQRVSLAHFLGQEDRKTRLESQAHHSTMFLISFPRNRIWESWYQWNEYVTQHKAASDQEETWAAVQCAVPHFQPQQGPSSWSMLRPFSGPAIHSSFQGQFNSWPLYAWKMSYLVAQRLQVTERGRKARRKVKDLD